MSIVWTRRKRIFRRWAWTVLFAATLGGTGSQAADEMVNVAVDQARLVKLPERVATIVIGNPLIADATLQPGGILVLTGKGYGSTNMVGLDRNGKSLFEREVRVSSAGTKDLVIVYKGIERESYSCAPQCERRITLGDSPAYFNATLTQSGTRIGSGGGLSGGGAPAPR